MGFGGFQLAGTALGLVALVAFNKIDRIQADVRKDEIAASVGSYALEIANGYVNKIAAYEADSSLGFVGPNVGDNLTYSSATEVVNNLKSNGTQGEACSDGTDIIGLAIAPYARCGLHEYIPGGNNTMSAYFERISTSNPPDGYTVGFSQIKGTIILGSEDIDTAFSNVQSKEANIDLAYRAASWVRRMGVMNNSTQVLSSAFSRVYVSEKGALVIDIDMSAKNDLFVKRDGSTPITGNQSFSGKEISDINKASFTSRYTEGGVEKIITTGSIVSGSDANGQNLVFILNAENKLELTAVDTSISTDKFDLTAAGEATFSASNFSLNSNGDLAINGTLSAANGKFTVDEDGKLTANDITTASGANLNTMIQNKSYYIIGSTVPDLDCDGNGTSKMLIHPVAWRSANSKPIVSVAPSQTATAGGYVVGIDIAQEDGSVSSASAGSYVAVEQWCG